MYIDLKAYFMESRNSVEILINQFPQIVLIVYICFRNTIKLKHEGDYGKGNKVSSATSIIFCKSEKPVVRLSRWTFFFLNTTKWIFDVNKKCGDPCYIEDLKNIIVGVHFIMGVVTFLHIKYWIKLNGTMFVQLFTMSNYCSYNINKDHNLSHL